MKRVRESSRNQGVGRCLHRITVFILLILPVGPAVAVDVFSESMRVDWDPLGALSVRATAEIPDRLEIAIAGRSGNENQRIRLGAATPSLVVGPLAFSGAYHELLGAAGGPWNDTWYAPGGVDLDASLDSSRRGLAVRLLSAVDLVLWEGSGVVVATRLGLGDRDFFGEMVGTLASPANIRFTDAEVTPAWFDDRAASLPIGNLIARLGGRAAGATFGSSVSVSVPRSTLPGLSLRGTAKVPLPGRWMFAAVASLATSEYRLPDGERGDDPARWGAAVQREGPSVDLGFDLARTYASRGDAYEAIGFATESLVGEIAEASAAIAIRRRDESRRVASVGAKVGLEIPPAGTIEWRMSLSSRLVSPDRRFELSPSLAIDSAWRVSARARAVYSVAALAFIVVGDYEWEPDAGDFDFSFSIRRTVERTTSRRQQT